MSAQIKVLVVDDSSLVRKIITDILESDPLITVVGTANNGKTAIYRTRELDPDVVTMDIEMPILDGLAALKYIMETNPKPVIMMSVLTQHGAEATFRALDLGAVDFIPKPSSVLSLSVDEIGDLLINKVKSVFRSRIDLSKRSVEPNLHGAQTGAAGEIAENGVLTDKTVSSKVVGIGTSTGGPTALLNVFKKFPEKLPSPVLVVQHMPEGFTKAFSERLDNSSRIKVKEAEDGDRIMPGHGYIAPGHSHMVVEGQGQGKYIRLYRGERVSGHMPSIDVLFSSLAEKYGSDSIGVIMTGMGRDGAEGIMNIKRSGGHTLAQDEATSIVYGMNRVAVQIGAVREEVPLFEITKKIVEYI